MRKNSAQFKKVAVVDIGSNSSKILIAKVNSGSVFLIWAPVFPVV